MTLIVETGSIIANANSYVSVADAQAILTGRGLSAVVTEAALLRAMDMLDGLEYCGYRVSDAQPLPFPRSGVTLSDSRPLSSATIPQELINAQAWASHYILSGSDPAAASVAGVKREKVDVLEVEYATSSKTSIAVSDLPNVKNALKYLVCSNAGRIDRA